VLTIAVLLNTSVGYGKNAEGTITGVKYSREEAAVAAAKLGHLKQPRRRAEKRIRCCR
jgi:hypothetical protein